MSDNVPLNSAEFRQFAQQYDFKHITSSPQFHAVKWKGRVCHENVQALNSSAANVVQNDRTVRIVESCTSLTKMLLFLGLLVKVKVNCKWVCHEEFVYTHFINKICVVLLLFDTLDI